MKQQITEQTAGNAGNLIESGEDRRILDTLKIEALGFLPDRNLTILWASNQFYEKTGYSEKEFHNSFQNLRQFYAEYPNDFETIIDELSGAIDHSVSDTVLTAHLPQKGGRLDSVRIQITFTGESTGSSAGCLAVFTHMGEESLKTEEECRRFKKKSGYFKWMLDEYAGNAYVSDMETYDLLYLNQTSCETLGMPLQKVLGGKCYEVIQGRTSPCPFCTNHLLNEDEFYEWEFHNPVLDRTFLIKDRIVDWEGKRARLELSHDNFSSEYKLVKKEREREAIIRTIPGGFARVDARDMRTILWYGGGFLQLIGYTKEQFEQELHSRCDYVHPDDIARALHIMQNSRETGEDTVVEGRIITHDGTIKILTMTYSYVSGENSWDGIESFYSVGIDITKEREEQERQSQALRDACQAARVASSAKTNFLSSMSHNIRTPMNAIMGMTAIAQANLNSPEKVLDCLNKIDTSSRHLLSLINEVLDMSKIESGKIDLILDHVNLPNLVQTIRDICRPLVDEKNQQFQISIGQVQHENVIADGERLQQILMNLLSNAIKYTPVNGTITLRVNEQYSPNPRKSQYEFICIDNGIGISGEFRPYVFEPFTRAEDPRISKLQGTGLGMTITENIVHMMNGTIEVESELGVGSKFTVSVPLELWGEEESYSCDLQGLPVLVADGDPVVGENAAALLNELGMKGTWVLSAEEAIRRIAEAHDNKDDYFAVILDWNMPGADGLETVRTIREMMKEKVPAILISDNNYSESEEEFLRAGADAFLAKPYFKSKMLQVLHLFVPSGHSVRDIEKKKVMQSEIGGKRVLLAEDNDINREIAIELLRMQNLNVIAVENGRQAKEAFEASEPGEYDAVLMDIQMPVMDGYDATGAIRALNREDARTVPIIALTANAFTADAAKARSVGMNDHIAKPIEINRLLEVLQKWIG